MKVYHVEFAKVGGGLSGGEKCMIEIIKYFQTRGIHNVLLTTDNGKSVYENLGLKENPLLSYVTIPSAHTERYHAFISYLLRLGMIFKIKNEIVRTINFSDDVLMCHSDFFPNTLATWRLSKYFRKVTFWWFHMLAPHLFKGFEGEYTGKRQLPRMRILHYILNQQLFKLFSKNGLIITVNPLYSSLFKDKNSTTYVLRKFGGDVYPIKKYGGVNVNAAYGSSTKYDLFFMGRFHEQKGLFEIPKILLELKKLKHDINIAVVGGGNKDIERKFFSMLEEAGLKENVTYLGFISSDEKFFHMTKAKIFIFPSYYESFGQVALEAMAHGLPVVAYDLPVFGVFEKGMVKVPVLDNKAFAVEIYKLLNDEAGYKKASREAVEYSKTFSWNKTGEEIYNLLSHI